MCEFALIYLLIEKIRVETPDSYGRPLVGILLHGLVHMLEKCGFPITSLIVLIYSVLLLLLLQSIKLTLLY